MHALFLLSIDKPGMSRVDANSLPQQTKMELLIAGITDTSKFREGSDAFLDLDQWIGLQLSEGGEVTRICFACMFSAFFREGGTIHLQWLPHTVTHFTIAKNMLEGTCDTVALPRGIIAFRVSTNKLHGTFDLTSLPDSMQDLMIAENAFSGTLDIRSLPPAMMRFVAHSNSFAGELDLSALPEGLRKLTLDKHRFEADYSLVPEDVEGLHDHAAFMNRLDDFRR